MPYTVPTVDDFTTRFPIFENYDEDQIQSCIDEASRGVDTCWVEGDYQPAIMYLAAHLLATDASQTTDAVIGGASGAIASESFGPMSVSYGSAPTDSLATSGEFGSTSYGRRYLSLLRINKPPVVVV